MDSAGTGRRRFLRGAAASAVGAITGGLIAGGSPTAVAKSTRAPTLLSGRGVPKASKGRLGDFYIDTRTDRLYGPKKKVARAAKKSPWGTPTNLRGLQGPPGAPGSPGAPGAAGSAGATGAKGDRGYSVLHGVGSPTISVGVDGDFYIETAATQIYGPKAGGIWGSPTNLTGPAAPDTNLVYGALAGNPDGLVVGSIERDANGAATVADVVWPDGTPGRYTATKTSAKFPGAVDAYEITYGEPPTRTYTQPAVTRDPSTGAVTDRPAITVT